jgi:hypothetical protein
MKQSLNISFAIKVDSKDIIRQVKFPLAKSTSKPMLSPQMYPNAVAPLTKIQRSNSSKIDAGV